MATKKEETNKKTTAAKATATKKTTAAKATTAKKTTAAKATTAKKTTAAKATTAKKTTATKATAAKKTTATKSTTSKKATTKTATKKTSTSKKTEETKQPKVVKQTTGIKIEQKGNEGDLLGLLSATPITTPIPATEEPKTKTTKKSTTKKTTEKQTTKTTTPVRTLHKPKTFTKEEKVLYKRLEESFNYVANLTMVIEERTLDPKLITDLTLGELHVLEIVNKEATIPMTKVANQLKITVGSLTTCVNRLVKKEYLFRERDENDHRIIKVSTTQKAKKALKAHDLFHEQILLGVLDGVTIRDATKVMAQFARTLENYINPKEKNYDKPIDTKKKKNN